MSVLGETLEYIRVEARKRRRAAGLTQKVLAELAHTQVHYVNFLEGYGYCSPSPMRRICNQLGLDKEAELFIATKQSPHGVTKVWRHIGGYKISPLFHRDVECSYIEDKSAYVQRYLSGLTNHYIACPICIKKLNGLLRYQERDD
jgi:hypothetical protein